MNERLLFVTLGHNSSAILVEDDVVVRGYEQERLDRRKSSSAYPKEAIERCTLGKDVTDVYVSHWFDDCSLNTNKYLDSSHLHSFGALVRGPTYEHTHHDLHAESAVGFFLSHDSVGPYDVIVCDGFGTRRECLSVYQASSTGRLVKTHRTYGYNRSLGLMYQYVTEYLGLKPNRDEYKLLGYESHVLQYASYEDALYNRGVVQSQALLHVERMLDSRVVSGACDKGLINMEALMAAKAYWTGVATEWRRLWREDLDIHGTRACVAFCAQTFIEACVNRIIDYLGLGRLGRPIILTGGCFYNVKLNRSIARRPGISYAFAHPICGDQGAALGFRRGTSVGGLLWGDRAIGLEDPGIPDLYVVDQDRWVKEAAHFIARGAIVNVVRGPMEFGPRALCNTTTFALPTVANVKRINDLNERDEAMPMAPVMTRRAAKALLNHAELLTQRISDQYMITTCAFQERPPDSLMGVAHKDPIDDVWTARPQIVDAGYLFSLLSQFEHETLINTSFNYHGEPIVMSQEDAVRTHQMQQFRAKLLGVESPVTLLVRS